MIEDLAERHEPISDMFEIPTTADGWAPYRLSDEQVAFYHEHGYVAPVTILDDAQVDRLCDELAELVDPSHPGNKFFYEFHSNESTQPETVLFHALGAWRITSGFHDLAWAPAMTMAARQLLDGPVRFWHDQLFCKPARHGGVVAWHQDYSYWTRTSPMAHLTCWIALDDCTAENGCMQYVPGSHLWDLLPVTGLAGDMEAIRGVLNDDQWERLLHPRAIEVKRGQATFHHPLMIHGSRENFSDRPRRATVVNFFADGVASASNEPLLDGVPVFQPGERLEGKFFPMLHS